MEIKKLEQIIETTDTAKLRSDICKAILEYNNIPDTYEYTTAQAEAWFTGYLVSKGYKLK